MPFFRGRMSATKEILLKGPAEAEQYERAKQLAASAGVPIGSLLLGAVDEIVRRNKAEARRAALLQSQRDQVRAKRRGM